MANENAFGQCYAASVRGTRHSVRTAALFTLCVVDFRVGSYRLETKSNIP